ncbi:MAG: hypothetical protein ACOVMN_11410, partial [Flexibacteraceae bacterium]
MAANYVVVFSFGLVAITFINGFNCLPKNMSSIIIVFVSVSYLSLLFLIAFLAEKHQQTFKKNGRLWTAIYALSVSVYCTAWTFYGSIGMATRSGLEFLTVYLGPAIMAPLWFVFLRKIVRICKLQQI